MFLSLGALPRNPGTPPECSVALLQVTFPARVTVWGTTEATLAQAPRTTKHKIADASATCYGDFLDVGSAPWAEKTSDSDLPGTRHHPVREVPIPSPMADAGATARGSEQL